MPLTRDAELAQLLQETRTIALVGASDRPDRPSYKVMQFLLEQGYRIVPINPALAGQDVLGQTVVATLAAAGPVDLVDIFRNSEAVGPIVDAAIDIGAKAVWMQLGVINPDAAQRAEAAGLKVVMDHCPKIEIARLGVAKVG